MVVHLGAAYDISERLACKANDDWAVDFMSDALFDGRAFRLLTIVDCCSR
jgi:putative transposase